MDPATHRDAEIILRRLCVGRSVCGVHFYADQPILVLASYDGAGGEFGGPAEAYLVIEAGWSFAPSGQLPVTEEAAAPERSLEHLAAVACSVRRSPIVAVDLEQAVPHLSVHFKDGQTLRVNGWDARYEVWIVAAGDWSIWALDNGRITWGVGHPALS